MDHGYGRRGWPGTETVTAGVSGFRVAEMQNAIHPALANVPTTRRVQALPPATSTSTALRCRGQSPPPLPSQVQTSWSRILELDLRLLTKSRAYHAGSAFGQLRSRDKGALAAGRFRERQQQGQRTIIPVASQTFFVCCVCCG